MMDEEDRRTLILAFYYELRRRECEQWGYRAITDLSCDLQSNRVFKTFTTVREWIELGGWPISNRFKHWQGYVEYVFDYFAPKSPHPGQLKNRLLMRNYLQSYPKTEPQPMRTDAELEELYRRIVDPEIRECVCPTTS
jgi:hypothetical protein